MRNPQSGKLVSARQLSAEWGVSISTVMRILRRAEIPVYCLGHGRNGTVRVKRTDVDQYVESCRE